MRLPCRCLAVPLAVTALLAPRALDASPVVALQPLGEVSPAMIRSVAARIESTFDVELVVRSARPLPASALHRPRNRYRGEKTLEWLRKSSPRATAVLGLMSRDLSVTKGRAHDWGVLGVASPEQAAGVVSTHRLGRRATPRLVARRAGRVAVHELAHVFGLPHCRSARCVMNDAGGRLATVDRSSGRFCTRCRTRLGTRLRAS